MFSIEMVMSIFVVLLGALVVPASWGLYRGQDCRAAYSCAEKAKQEVSNVMRSLVVSSTFSCMRQCLDDSLCSAVNWRQTDGLCQLCSDSDPGTMLNDPEFVHFSTKLCDVVAMDCTKVCPAPFQVVADSCVWVSTIQTDWTSSRQNCMEMGGDLAVVRSLAHALDLMAFVQVETGLPMAQMGCVYEDNVWNWLNGDIGYPNNDFFSVGGATLLVACGALYQQSPGAMSLWKVDCDTMVAPYMCEIR